MFNGSIPLFTTSNIRVTLFFDILRENTREISKRIVLFDKKVIKGVWRMPWILEAMKDVISCEKLRGSAHKI